jgi:hypothetical protein
MQGVADIFRNRQDGSNDDGEEFGDLRRRAWRNDAVECCALARRAGHVTVPSGRGVPVFGHPDFSTGEKIRSGRRRQRLWPDQVRP